MKKIDIKPEDFSKMIEAVKLMGSIMKNLNNDFFFDNKTKLPTSQIFLVQQFVQSANKIDWDEVLYELAYSDYTDNSWRDFV